MSNIVIGNYTSDTANDIFQHIWKLTRAMKASGYRVLGSSNGVNSATGSNVGDLWGSASNPLDDVFPTNTTLTTGSWIIFQGPSTIKVPIHYSFTGSFVRGENLSQGSTGFQSELIGCNLGSGQLNGYLVLGNRVSGSSTGSFGMNVSALTGAISNQTITPISEPQEYIREIVFWRGSNPKQGSIYYQCVLSGALSSSGDIRFSSLTGTVGCTETVAPGGGGVNNTFPASGSFVVLGTASTNTPANWCFGNYGGNFGCSQIMVCDATGSSLRTADGSFNFFIGLTTTGTRVYGGFSFGALDNTENGDVDPYAFWAPSLLSNNQRTRTASTYLPTPTAADGVYNANISSGNQYAFDSIVCFRRRGFSSGDRMINCSGGYLLPFYITIPIPFATLNNTTEIEGEATSFDSKRIKEPIWVLCPYDTMKTRKGTFRWLYYGAANTVAQRANDTFDNKAFVQITDGTYTSLIAGPYDGSTTPVNGI